MTRAAPFCSKQSANPPVLVPKSSTFKPATESCVCASAPASFMPARETNLSVSESATCNGVVSSNSYEAFLMTCQSRPLCIDTRPSLTNRCACARDSARFCVTSTWSIRGMVYFISLDKILLAAQLIKPYTIAAQNAVPKVSM